jgi:pimeloyl-ACP methyl ester carboxylesterase
MYRIKAVASAPPTNNLPTIAKSLSGLAMGGKKLVLWRNRPPDVSDPRVTRAYIVIHGAGANAEGYFDRLNEVVPSDWVQSTIVLAPYFQLEADASSGEWWWADDWREGGASGGLSSYTAMDNLIATLRSGYFPNLKWVVVCGHSAGGQFTQRYAAFTDIDLRSAPNSPFIKFVPANPSSYVYLNEYRPGPNNTWIIPQECSSGDHYNEWKYGLDGLYGYTAARGVNWPRTHLPTCQVELLAGTADVNEDHGFDASCAAMRQGPTRYERAHNFNAYMDQFYPSNRFSITDVPGVGHDSTLMFASPQGRAALFFAD